MSRSRALFGGTMLLTLWLSAGCASHNPDWSAGIAPQGEWRWERSYEGPPRPLSEIAVLWVASAPLALRVNSIDGVGVREATEYHLLPGYHLVVTQPGSQGNLTITGDPPPTLGCTLEAGSVYWLTADVTWEKADYQATPWGSNFSQRFQWTPRTEAVGSCVDVVRYLASDEGRALPGEKPPAHWRSTALEGLRPAGGTPPTSADSSATKGDWDLAEALNVGVVDAEATGAGMSLVSLRVRRKVDRPIHVTVPAGTFFACRGTAQNMVALAETTIDLRDDAWQPVMVTAACVDFARNVPQPSDTFLIQGPAHQQDLRKLMAVLCRVTWPTDVQPRDVGQALRAAQAAIWIVAGDATYEHLGVLRRNAAGGAVYEHQSALQRNTVGGENTAVNPRSIDETDAAMAMRLVDEGGIDIKNKAIWRDRQVIARGVSDTALRNWLDRR